MKRTLRKQQKILYEPMVIMYTIFLKWLKIENRLFLRKKKACVMFWYE